MIFCMNLLWKCDTQSVFIMKFRMDNKNLEDSFVLKHVRRYFLLLNQLNACVTYTAVQPCISPTYWCKRQLFTGKQLPFAQTIQLFDAQQINTLIDIHLRKLVLPWHIKNADLIKLYIFTRLNQILYFYMVYVGRNSIFSIATHYGLDVPGIESRWGRDFPHPSRPTPGGHPASYTMGTRSFPGSKRLGHDIDHPTPASTKVKKNSRTIPLLPFCAVACSRVTFTFTWFILS